MDKEKGGLTFQYEVVGMEYTRDRVAIRQYTPLGVGMTKKEARENAQERIAQITRSHRENGRHTYFRISRATKVTIYPVEELEPLDLFLEESEQLKYAS